MKATFTSTIVSTLLVLTHGQYTYYYNYSLNFVAFYTGGSSISWSNARSHCETQFDTTLVSIHSDFENSNIRLIANLSGAAGGRVHIGLNDISTEGTYVWTDRRPVDYTNWRPGEPNNYYGTGSEDCVDMRASGEWNDYICGGSQTVVGGVCFIANITYPPTSIPSNDPSFAPTDPTVSPTLIPSIDPTVMPSGLPTDPTHIPTVIPTSESVLYLNVGDVSAQLILGGTFVFSEDSTQADQERIIEVRIFLNGYYVY